MSGTELDTTIDDWREAMSEVVADDPGLTIRELCEKMGTKRTATTTRITDLIIEGKCVRGRATRVINGRISHVNVYQLTTREKKR